MARKFPDPPEIERDGTSQAGRVQPALDPGYVSVDERSAQDLLELSRKYAGELLYFDERGSTGEDWTPFLDQDLGALAALVDGEPTLGAATAGRVDRPHLALFLAFLRLLRYPRELVNSLTRRHLELYYEQLLRMSRKPAVPDRVHVLPRLAAGVERARLLEGTLLRAGKDDLGRERIYRTDRELVVGRASVARLSSVYAQKDVVGLREARERYQGPRQDAVLQMLAIALGDPRPGSPLPAYGGKAVTYPLLLELKERIDFAGASLFMDFSDLHSMMQLVRQRGPAADAEWSEINRILEKAGQAMRHDPTWRLNPVNPRDFTANLNRAIAGPLDFASDGLPEVDSIDDLYDQRLKQDVARYINSRLYLSVDDFTAMMRIKVKIDSEWREINRILEQAGRRKRNTPSYKIDPKIPLTDFAARLAAAVGPLPFDSLDHALLPAVTNLDAYYDEIVRLEAYFRLNAVQVGYILSAADRWVKSAATDIAWSDVYRLLSDAYEEKVYADRRKALRTAQEGAADRVLGFAAMLRVALGRELDDPREVTLADLRQHVALPQDYSFLESVQARLAGGTITADEWTRVYQVVELAQRVREKLPKPVPRRETWIALHATEDATSVAAGPAEPNSKLRRWKTFGQRPLEALNKPPVGLMGWAIASPTLLLTQGKRTVVLTLGFDMKQFDPGKLRPLFDPNAPDTNPFVVEISTEKGWLALAADVTVGDYRTLTQVSRAIANPLGALQLKLTLDETAAATAPPSREASGISSPWPVLRLTLRAILNPQTGQYSARYESFRDLILEAVHLKASADGLVPSSIQNDDAVLSAKKPFEPFGTSPAVGARFYVGDPELVAKRLDKLTFHVEWRGAPSDLTAHYTNYTNVPAGGAFTANVFLVDNRARLPLTISPTDPQKISPVSLFADTDGTKPRDITIDTIPALVERQGSSYRYRPLADLPAGTQVSTWPRHFEWELTPYDFKHSVYPAVATQKSLELAAAILDPAIPKPINAAAYQVKPPYTPRIKTFFVNYVASTEVVLDAASAGVAVDRLLHVHPFGASPIQAETDIEGTRFLPRYDEGELYIGLRDVKAPETVTLLFQVAEGSANPDLLPVPLEWSRLSGDRWVTLHDGHLLSDTTHGLIDSGIVQIALEPALPSTRLPGELYWIRASIPYNADSVCDMVGIHAQAVSATFVDHDNSPTHLAQKLPARSITGLVQRLAPIAAIEQPYPSRGGRPAEAAGGFYTRVSERLRHKQRALTLWDYERLVLERFPELYKVKCLPATADNPGAVDLIVIPSARGQSLSNPFEPKVPAGLIAQIEEYLADKRPPQAKLRVRNAQFVQVKVRVGVRFRGEGDEGFYKALLNEELNRYLSPWAYDEGADVVLGGKIFADSIIAFIDGRDYVDYVATIELFRSEDGGRTFTLAPRVPNEGYSVATNRPDGVLVAARQHEIDVISEVGYTAESFTGINYMRIELDFIVG